MGASVAGILLLLQPVLSFVWEVIFFQKRFHYYQLIGAGAALVAIFLGMRGQQRNLKG
jgi:drug/metabolite transporter (DMT)-like permease